MIHAYLTCQGNSDGRFRFMNLQTCEEEKNKKHKYQRSLNELKNSYLIREYLKFEQDNYRMCHGFRLTRIDYYFLKSEKFDSRV